MYATLGVKPHTVRLRIDKGELDLEIQLAVRLSDDAIGANHLHRGVRTATTITLRLVVLDDRARAHVAGPVLLLARVWISGLEAANDRRILSAGLSLRSLLASVDLRVGDVASSVGGWSFHVEAFRSFRCRDRLRHRYARWDLEFTLGEPTENVRSVGPLGLGLGCRWSRNRNS